jgi:hypothetical protein
MGALEIQKTSTTIPNEALEHISILTELLRDVDLEGRMMTLIKAEDFLGGQETSQLQLESIRTDLELELDKMKKMIFIVEKAQHILDL